MSSRLLALSLVSLLGLAACGSTGRSRASGYHDSMETTQSSLATFMASLDGLQTSLKDLRKAAKTNPQPAFDAYLEQVDTVNGELAALRGRVTTMRQKGEDYFKKWEEEMGTVSSPELKKLADQRRAQLSAAYAKIQATAEEAKKVGGPAHEAMMDLCVFLENDMTEAGIKAADDMIDKVIDGAASVNKQLRQYQEQVKAVAAMLPKKPPTGEPAKEASTEKK
jgi:hypothetical protein